MTFIPQIEPWIDDTELEELSKVIATTYITENQKTEEFLEGIRQITRSPQAIATSNGTLALVAALICSDVKAGDEVIVPDLTFIASSNAVRLVGAMPIFCDVERATGCLDISSCEELITEKTKAIMPVHLYGQSVEMDALVSLANKNNLTIIEDAAESLGVFYKGQHTGTFGRFGTFSFFANKTITCGEGGVVLSRSADDQALLYRIKNHGRDRKGIFVHESVGYNFCFTDLQAAIGVAQLKKFDRIITAKRRLFSLYQTGLADVVGVTVVGTPDYVDSNHWFINILVDDPEALTEYLASKGIGSRRYFYPLHLQPCYKEIAGKPCANSLWLYEHGLSLPSGVMLKDEQVEQTCSAISSFFRS